MISEMCMTEWRQKKTLWSRMAFSWVRILQQSLQLLDRRGLQRIRPQTNHGTPRIADPVDTQMLFQGKVNIVPDPTLHLTFKI
jgi:hypothetical protein